MKLADNISIEYKEFKSDRTIKDIDSLIEKEKIDDYSTFNYYFELEETEDVIIFGRLSNFDELAEGNQVSVIYRGFALNTVTVDKKTKVLTNHADNTSLDTYDVLNNLPVWTTNELLSIGIKASEDTTRYAFQALRIARERDLNN